MMIYIICIFLIIIFIIFQQIYFFSTIGDIISILLLTILSVNSNKIIQVLWDLYQFCK